ncbi:MAG TPA: PilZ domain-containing protein [bacterium]|nr:PilZ domain-containing protein [bacterium]
MVAGKAAEERAMEGSSGRRYNREKLILRAAVRLPNGMNYAGVVSDVSVVGICLYLDHELPVGTAGKVQIADMKFAADGTVVRVVRKKDVYEVALQFDGEQQGITGKILEYKVRRRAQR